MTRKHQPHSNVEPLESRIAPAGVFPKVIDAKWRTATLGTPLELTAGEGLSTLGDKSGSYLLFVEKGNCLVFTTDFNKDNQLDPNEITGIAAGDGLRIILFTDIHGDIVTNLNETVTGNGRTVLTLTDSDRNPINDDPRLFGDGKVVLDSRIEKIEFRPLALTDIPDQNNIGVDVTGDGIIDPDDEDLDLRVGPQTSFSIYGKILAGGGFGADDGGLLFNTPNNDSFLPRVDGIYTGTAVSGKFFSFGTSGEHILGNVKIGDNINGITADFVPRRGQPGASINTVASSAKIGAIEAVKGTAATPELQLLDLTNANSGIGKGFKLTYGGLTTKLIPAGSDAATVQTALNAAGITGVTVANQAASYAFAFSTPGDKAGVITALIAGGALYSVGTLQAGDGGVGAPGGSIINVILNGDDETGYTIIAGDGGGGPNGGNGGSIVNFSDLGSSTAQVYIRTGSGGNGATGRGGNAGDVDLDNVNIKGDVAIDLGDGGGGFLAGGNGASLLRGTYVEPEDQLVLGSNGYGTAHLPGTEAGFAAGNYLANFGATVSPIGTHNTLDFDNDGTGDFVYTTRVNSALVVLFGDPASVGFRPVPGPDGVPASGMYLHGPRNARALATGDLNADGHPDIAVASGDIANPGDIMVFLSKFEDLNNDGVVSFEEDIIRNDLNGDGIYDENDVRDDFLGFWEPRHSTLPVVSYVYEVQSLAIGDFDGDGLGEIAAGVSLVITSKAIGDASNFTFAKAPAVGFFMMSPDLELNPISEQFEPTGQFYADYGTPQVLSSTNGVLSIIPAVDLVPYSFYLPPPTDGIDLEATALGPGSTFDSLLVSFQGMPVVETYQWPIRSALSFAPLPIGVFDLGPVDLDRGAGVNLAPFSLHDFTVVDMDFDGLADVVAISTDNQPYFINGSIGDGLGNGFPGSGTGNNAGNFFSPNVFVLHSIRSGDATGDGSPNEFFTLSGIRPAGATLILAHLWAPGPDSVGTGAIGPVGRPVIADQAAGGFMDSRPISTASFVPTVVGNGEATEGWAAYTLLGLPAGAGPFVEYGFTIRAGDGGNSLQGRGGAGGSLGGKSGTTTLLDPLTGLPSVDPITGVPIRDLVGALDFTVTIPVTLLGGKGGDGFSTGGAGGFISGVEVDNLGQSFPTHQLIAGNGGRGVSGFGGAGGSISSSSVDFGVLFQAGAGGVGRFGGAGGSVIGNGVGISDADTEELDVFAGAGGIGIRGGGNGGSISNFHPTIHDKPRPGLFTYLQYTAGDGGSTVTGRGGDGGSVVNSSPVVGTQFVFDIYIGAGDGGNGASGGSGGSISKFVNLADGGNVAFVPRYVSFLAGNGGRGTSGLGGNGGSVTAIDVDTANVATDLPVFAGPGPYLQSPNTERFFVERIIAGNGGASSGSRGGNGGALANLKLNSIQGAWVIAAGAGGGGLHTGGTGGGISNVLIELGSSTFSKALFVAGKGGDAHAFTLNPDDPAFGQTRRAFGGRVGRGGEGGSLTNITQTTGIAAHVDLIAGNGGDTVHYGTPLDKPKGTFVGKGGSIRDIVLAGEAGNTDSAVGMKSYNNVLANETIQDFIFAQFLDSNPLLPASQLTDITGNVGVIVGSAGRNKEIVLDPIGHPAEFRSLASRNGINGSLENFNANGLMSALAGSIDRVASIQVVRNLRVDQQVGSDKLGAVNFEEFDPASNSFIATVSGEPVLDGRNIDGAIITKKFLDAAGKPAFPPPNTFFR